MYETAKCLKFDANSPGKNHYALKIVMVSVWHNYFLKFYYKQLGSLWPLYFVELMLSVQFFNPSEMYINNGYP